MHSLVEGRPSRHAEAYESHFVASDGGDAISSPPTAPAVAFFRRVISLALKCRHERHNFNLDSTHQAGQGRNKERNTEEHREPQTDVEQQGGDTPPHKPGPPAGLREGLALALEAGGPELRPLEPRPTERGGRADAPPGTPTVGALRTSAAGSEEPEAATKVRSRRDAPRQVVRLNYRRKVIVSPISSWSL